MEYTSLGSWSGNFYKIEIKPTWGAWQVWVDGAVERGGFTSKKSATEWAHKAYPPSSVDSTN